MLDTSFNDQGDSLILPKLTMVDSLDKNTKKPFAHEPGNKMLKGI